MFTVKFKSTPEFYEKEKSGIKNNTVREDDGEKRFKMLKEADLSKEWVFIEIVNAKTKESFSRKLRDISIYKNIYVLTW